MNLKTDFIEFLIAHKALQFGDFTLKSLRKSPYFFNLGVFNSGESLYKLGEFYAKALDDSKFECEVLFGPAYKGIALAAATSIAIYKKEGKDMPFAFNRKEAKDHGDGGEIVGSSMRNKKVIMLDDVITAGITVRETFQLLKNFSATFSGIIIAFDRQEKGINPTKSAIQETEEQLGVQVWSILKLEDLIEYLKQKKGEEHIIKEIELYQEKYGC